MGIGDKLFGKKDDMNLTVGSRRTLSPMTLSISRPRGMVIGFWVVTVLLCLQLGFTAYAQWFATVVQCGIIPPCTFDALPTSNGALLVLGT